MLEAVVKSLNIKLATCPYCSRQRPYYLDDSNSPIPLLIPFYNILHESREMHVNSDSGNLISSFINKTTLKDDDASYQDDELVDKVIEIIDENLKVLETNVVKSNTKDTIVVSNKFSGQRFYKQYVNNIVFYRFKGTKVMDSKKAKKSLYSNNVFMCECGEKYLVEKM